LKTKNSTITKIKLSRIEKDENDIEKLKGKYTTLEAKYNLIEMQNAQMVTSFRILLPLLEKLAEGNESVGEAINVVKEFILKEDN